MKKELTQTQIKEIGKQLGKPTGEIGIEIGKKMNESNIGMTLSTIKFLDIEDENNILELGHGNCGHLHKILDSAQNINFFGLEISETMCEEAKKISCNNQANFRLYNGKIIPFEDNYFDKIMSVNTIYFWENPKKLINEIERTLKQDGFCVLTFADKEFMEKLPFVGGNFTLFNKNDIQELVKLSNMKIVEFKDKTEQVESKTGEEVERKYIMVKLKKDINS